MKVIIKILNKYILFILFIVSLTSCKKETKQVNDKIMTDTIRINKLGLFFEKSEDDIMLKIVSLDSTSSENYHFSFQKDEGYYTVGKQNIFGYFNCKKLLKEIDVRNKEQEIAEFLIGNEPIVLLDNICPILEKRRYISKKELFSLFNPLPKLNAGSADR